MVISIAKVTRVGLYSFCLYFLEPLLAPDVEADHVWVPGAHAADRPDALDHQIAPDLPAVHTFLPAVHTFSLPGNELFGHLALCRVMRELPAALHFGALKAERRPRVRPVALCKSMLLHFLDALPAHFVFPLRASRHHCDAESPVHVLRVHAVLGTVKEHAARLPRFHALQGVHSVAKGPVGADDKDYVARCQKRIHLAPFRP